MDADREKVDSVELALDGKITAIFKDEDGKALWEEDLDGEVVLKALMLMFQSGVSLLP